jgi:hypothetical protein
LTFGTTRVVGRQPQAPAALTPRGNPWYSFLEAESTPGHMVPTVATEKIPSVTPRGIDPETVRLVAQCLNHYATPGLYKEVIAINFEDHTYTHKRKQTVGSCDDTVLNAVVCTLTTRIYA